VLDTRRIASSPGGEYRPGLMQRLRRVFLAVGVAGLFAAAFRVRGKGGTPPSDGGWRQLDGPELR
jgi:hypothetical protein